MEPDSGGGQIKPEWAVEHFFNSFFSTQKIEKETNKVIKIRNFIWKRSIVKCSTTNRPLCYQPYSSIHPNPKIAFVLFEAQNIRLCYGVWTRGRTLITFRFYGIAVPLVFLSMHIAHAIRSACQFRFFTNDVFINVIKNASISVGKVQPGSRLWPLVWGSRVPAAIFAAHDKWWSCGTLASVAS